ncbi:MAG: cohesin domain-containing protein [Bacteroidetes bacterium]|nr:cohesin domain-containing protein [Bacteroidota bacterium]MCL5027267.1 cohesin domain-containing protein [Chloroflexota bacterium]
MRDLAQGLVVLVAVMLLVVAATSAGKLALDQHSTADLPAPTMVAAVPPAPTAPARPGPASTAIVSLPAFPAAPVGSSPPGPGVAPPADAKPSIPLAAAPASPARPDAATAATPTAGTSGPAAGVGMSMSVLNPTAPISTVILPSLVSTPATGVVIPTTGVASPATPTGTSTAASIAAGSVAPPTATAPARPTNVILPANTPLPTATPVPTGTRQPTTTTAPSPAGGVAIAMVPAATRVAPGQTVSVDIHVAAGSQPVDGVEVHIDFDPMKLQVVESDGRPASKIVNGTAFTMDIMNAVDNPKGRIDYAIGAAPGSGNERSGSFVVASFRAVATGETTLKFSSTLPRKTDITYSGKSVLTVAPSPVSIPVQ